MGLPRFHVQTLTGSPARLSPREGDHATKARRLAIGDEVALFDGAGREALGRITSIARAAVEVAFEQCGERPRPSPSLTLAIALPKGPRQDVLIEKCTELGAAAVVPLLTARSISGATEHKLDRWRQTAIEAAKQSGQAWLPVFHPPEPLAQALTRVREHDLSVAGALTAEGDHGLVRLLAAAPVPASILAFIGPEGGWTDEEIAMLTAAGCQCVNLGPNILRVETAAIAIAAWVHAWQRVASDDAEPGFGES